METVTDFIFLGSKITANGDCSHEIKRCLLLGRTAMTNLDNLLKSRAITLPTKVHIVKVMVFPVVMYGCETWTTEKTEDWRIDTFKLWCWRRLLRVPWRARRSNQSILKEINPVLWPPDVKSLLTGKNPDAGKNEAGREGDDREWDGWMALQIQWTWVWANSRWQGRLVYYCPWGHNELDTS